MVDVIVVQKAEIWRTFVSAAALPSDKLRVWEFLTGHSHIDDGKSRKCREKQLQKWQKEMHIFDAFAAAAGKVLQYIDHHFDRRYFHSNPTLNGRSIYFIDYILLDANFMLVHVFVRSVSFYQTTPCPLLRN